MKKNDFFNTLNDKVEIILKNKNKVLVCITGKAGSGKSTLGKYLRKKGFGNFSKYAISVIDDGVMSQDIFYIFNKRVKIKTTKQDELKPFLKLLPKRKKIIFYVNQAPEIRLSKTDIVVYADLGEETIKERITQRDGTYNMQNDNIIKIDYKYLIKINMEKYSQKIFLKKKIKHEKN